MARCREDRARPDVYARRAKAQGSPARSVFKLEEMDQRWRLLRPGQTVLDLGAAPGSWTQYAAQKVGPSGRVLAFDLKPLAISLPAQVNFRVQDVYTLEDTLPRIDVVLSDMAPNTMGHHQTDALRSAALAEHALALALRFGREGGSLVVKVLEGSEVPPLAEAIRVHYRTLARLRPKATRAQSTEIFLIGLGLKPLEAQGGPEAS